MVPSHRRALRARLLSFPGSDLLRLGSQHDVREQGDKVMAGETPANPATMAWLTSLGKSLTKLLVKPVLQPGLRIRRRLLGASP